MSLPYCVGISTAVTSEGTTTSSSTTTTSISSLSMTVCPKCGSVKKSGKLSCCARGGAWFKNCGDGGDSNFDHTWVEGIEACKGMFSAVRTLPGAVCWVCVLFPHFVGHSPNASTVEMTEDATTSRSSDPDTLPLTATTPTTTAMTPITTAGTFSQPFI